jgi:hypothetical protein
MRKNERAGKKRERRVNTRTQSFERMLIITEGTNTEIAYFTSIKEHIQERFRENLIVDKIDIDLKGTGRGTMEVINHALKSKNRHTYSNVWVLFDQDDFIDFDDAIKKGTDEGLSVAWSNRSFELWFLLHFQHVTTPMDNKALTEKLSTHLQQKGIINEVYSKKHQILYSDLRAFVADASKRSERLLEQYHDDGISLPSKMNPATTVYQLLDKMLPYLE